MAKIFKGIKQVSAKTFKEASDLEGYLWFVRTEVSEPEVTVIDGEEVVVDKYSNDEYDIYFGKRHYGHFCEGEINGLKTSISGLTTSVNELEGDVDGILDTLEDFVARLEEQQNVITGNTKAIEEIKANLADILVKDVDSNDKVLSVADGILSSKIELVYEGTKIK